METHSSDPTAYIQRSNPRGFSTVSSSIMVVDDDPDWVNECAFMIECLGYMPVTATSAMEAVDHMRTADIAIAIIDYHMPNCDGLSLIHRLSAIAAAEGRQTRFIMVTGHASMELAVDAMRASAMDFLQKPVDREDLRKALQRANGLHEASVARSLLLDKISSLSSELSHLTRLIDERPVAAPPAGAQPPAAPGTAATQDDERNMVDYIRGLLRTEAKRSKLGGGALFGDPAWNILLDLLLARLEKRAVSVSSACIASGAPTSTALRLIKKLISDDVLYRIQDERDGRRSFLGINANVEKMMLDYLAGQLQR